MTHEHSHQSHSPRGIFVLAALLAVFVAFAGGVIARPTSAFAKSPPIPTVNDLEVPVDVAPAHIMVRKVRDPQSTADASTFSGAISGPTSTTWGPIALDSETGLIPVLPGAYTVDESLGSLTWHLVGYQLLSSNTQNCSTDSSDYTTSGNDDVSFGLEPGQMKVVCVMNVRSRIVLNWTLIVCKIVDNNGDAIDDGGTFKFDVSWNQQLQAVVSLNVHESDGPNGKCETLYPPFDILAHVQEESVRPLGWNGDVSGYPMVQVDNGALASGDEATVTSGPNHVVFFHNKTKQHPRLGTITVTKKTTLNGINFPLDDGGWHINIKSASCQVNQTRDTVQGSPVGTVTFTNLPICNDYVVKEDTNSKPLYTPVGASVVTGVAPSGNTAVAFENARFFVPPCILNCGNDDTPTPTPTSTPPTSTPPAQTPTVTSTPDIPTATPTDVVLGEKTPGAQVTPLAPSTGTGVTSIVTGHSMVATLGLIGLVAAMFAFGATAIALRQRR